MISEIIERHKAYIECTYFTDSHNILISNTPLVTFNDVDIAHLSVRVSIRGNAAKLKSSKIRICSMSQMDYQIEHSGTSMKLDSSGDLIINLAQMCGNQKEVYLNEIFTFTLIRNTYNANADCELNITLEGNSKFVKFENNHARIIMGGIE